MRSKFLAALCVASLSVCSSQASAQAQISLDGVPADEMAEARKILMATYPVDERDEIFEGMVTQIGKQYAAAAMSDPVFQDPGIRAIMDDFFDGLTGRLMPVIRKHMPSIFEATAVAYAREFTLEELSDISAFAQTESGARYFRQASSLLGDPAVAQANQEYLADIQGLQRSASEEIAKKVRDYLSDNPEVAERMEARMSESN